MKFKIDHNNYNVLDLEKSVAFYEKALGFKEVRRYQPEDKSFTLVFMGNEMSPHTVELTCVHSRKEPYNLGDNEIHLCVRVDDYQAAHSMHKEMGCICYENEKMGLYFINDPDGYWIEVTPYK